jgi:hypothetical protein
LRRTFADIRFPGNLLHFANSATETFNTSGVPSPVTPATHRLQISPQAFPNFACFPL